MSTPPCASRRSIRRSATPCYVDGNRNGVRTVDIQRGWIARLDVEERLRDQFPGVDFGTLPDLPAVDGSSPPPGADPVRLGSSNMVRSPPAARPHPAASTCAGRGTHSSSSASLVRRARSESSGSIGAAAHGNRCNRPTPCAAAADDRRAWHRERPCAARPRGGADRRLRGRRAHRVHAWSLARSLIELLSHGRRALRVGTRAGPSLRRRPRCSRQPCRYRGAIGFDADLGWFVEPDSAGRWRDALQEFDNPTTG